MQRPRRIWIWVAVLAILIAGMGLRLRAVTCCPNGDEGESALNALTILSAEQQVMSGGDVPPGRGSPAS